MLGIELQISIALKKLAQEFAFWATYINAKCLFPL